MDFNLFDFMGIEAPPAPEPKAAKAEKKKEKKEKSGDKTIRFKLPCKVLVPNMAPFILELDGDGKAELTAREMADRVSYPVPLTFTQSKGGSAVGRPTISVAKAENTLAEGEHGTIRLGEVELDITDNSSAAMTDVLNENLGFKGEWKFALKDKTVVPILIGVADGEGDDEEDEDSDISTSDTSETPSAFVLLGSLSVETEDVAATAKEHLGDDVAEYKSFDTAIGTVYALKEGNATIVVPSKKDEEFDVPESGLFISLLWVILQYPSPEGKKKVTKEEICSFICAQGYPEYSADRTTFVKSPVKAPSGVTDGLVAVLKGSSKGAF